MWIETVASRRLPSGLTHIDTLQTVPMSPWLQLGLGGPRLLFCLRDTTIRADHFWSSGRRGPIPFPCALSSPALTSGFKLTADQRCGRARIYDRRDGPL